MLNQTVILWFAGLLDEEAALHTKDANDSHRRSMGHTPEAESQREIATRLGARAAKLREAAQALRAAAK